MKTTQEQQLSNLLQATRYWIERRNTLINLHKKLNNIEKKLNRIEARIRKINPDFRWAKYQFEIRKEKI